MTTYNKSIKDMMEGRSDPISRNTHQIKETQRPFRDIDDYSNFPLSRSCFGCRRAFYRDDEGPTFGVIK